MSTIGLQVVSLREAVLTIAADDYTAAVNEVTLVPEVLFTWSQSLGQRTATPVPVGVRWTLTIGYAQDFTTADALAIYLVEHAAQRKTITFTPVSGGRTITADVMVIPGQLGGPSGEILTATAVLPLFGEPVISEA